MKFYIESENGHDEKEVPAEKAAEEVKKQLEDGKWVTVEKQDGSTEILTGIEPKKADEALKLLEEEEAKEKVEDWKGTFGKNKVEEAVKDAKSATVTSKMKGG